MIKEIKEPKLLVNEDLDNINKIEAFFEEKDAHSAWGVMSYWNSESCSWNAEVEEIIELQSVDQTTDEARIRALLKLWGIKPCKIKWVTPSPNDWEECFKLITSRAHNFFYSEVIIDSYGGKYFDGYLSFRVGYDNVRNLYWIIRNWYISGDPECIRAEFIKYLNAVNLKVSNIKIDYMEGTNEKDL